MISRAFAFTLLVSGTIAHAQNREAQIDQSRILRPPTISSDATARTATDGAALSELLVEPDDAFGAQRFLKSQQNVRPFVAAAEVFGFKTNNVGLTRSHTEPDEFLVASTTFTYRTALGERAAFDVTVRGSAFRYNEFRVLDFNSIDAGFGVTWVPARLGGIALSARYNFTDLFSESDGDAFFKNHTIAVAAQKNFVLSRAHYFFAGLAAQGGFADPSDAQRDEYSAYGGDHVDLTRFLEADLSYRYGFFHYREEGSRRDHNQSVSIAVRYNVTDWFSASATTFFGWNRSNQRAFDYDVVNGGIGLGLTVRF